jgi:soluble lytic murein transglycosylase
MGRSLSIASFIVVVSLVPTGSALAAPLEPVALAFLEGDYREVVRQLGEKNVGGGEAMLLKAAASLKVQEFKKALHALRGLESRLAHLTDLIHFLRGEAYFGQKKYRQAAKSFRLSSRVLGSAWNDRADRRRAQALAKAKRFAAAAAAYQQILQGYPGHPQQADLRLAWAQSLLRARKRDLAVEQLHTLWLEFPAHKAADRARELLDGLIAKRKKIDRISPQAWIGRLQKLRWLRHLDRALDEIVSLRKRFPKMKRRWDLQEALTHRRAADPAKALPLLQGLARGPISRKERKLLADTLSWVEKEKAAAQLYLNQVPTAGTKKMKRGELKALKKAASIFARHGDYAAAMPLIRRVVKERPKNKALKAKLAWLSYRMGHHKVARALFQELNRKNDRGFYEYWQARSAGKAGDAEGAEKIYADLLENNLNTYYGRLARSRLVDMKKLKLDQPKGCQLPAQPLDFRSMLAEVSAKYASVLPGLDRVTSLWRMGMRDEAQRELRLVFLDFTWALHRHKKRAFRIRRPILRRWRGAAIPKRQKWGDRQRTLRDKKDEMSPALASLAQSAGMFYFGWRLGPRGTDPVRWSHPQAFAQIVGDTSRRSELDSSLLWAIMKTESAFRPDAISRVGAGGLMQIMPHTARKLAAEMKLDLFRVDQVFHPRTNLKLAGHYLRALADKFRGQLPLIAAAYNGGPHNVARWLDFRGEKMEMDEFIEEIPFAESKRYAKKIVRLVSLYDRTYCGADHRYFSNRLEASYLPNPAY